MTNEPVQAQEESGASAEGALGPAVGRRSFIDYCLALGGGLWAAAMAAPAAAYLWPAGSGGPAETTVKVGAVKEIAVGEAKIIQSKGKPILVIRRAEREFTALSAICTHLGCIVKWDAALGQVLCPCHAAAFSADGQVVSGPPPSPLTAYPVVITRDDQVLVKAV